MSGKYENLIDKQCIYHTSPLTRGGYRGGMRGMHPSTSIAIFCTWKISPIYEPQYTAAAAAAVAQWCVIPLPARWPWHGRQWTRVGGVYSMDASLQWMREGSAVTAVCRNVHVWSEFDEISLHFSVLWTSLSSKDHGNFVKTHWIRHWMQGKMGGGVRETRDYPQWCRERGHGWMPPLWGWKNLTP